MSNSWVLGSDILRPKLAIQVKIFEFLKNIFENTGLTSFTTKIVSDFQDSITNTDFSVSISRKGPFNWKNNNVVMSLSMLLSS